MGHDIVFLSNNFTIGILRYYKNKATDPFYEVYLRFNR